jgi:hypothetical protein
MVQHFMVIKNAVFIAALLSIVTSVSWADGPIIPDSKALPLLDKVKSFAFDALPKGFKEEKAPKLGSGVLLSVDVKGAVNAGIAIDGSAVYIQEIGNIDATQMDNDAVTVFAGTVLNSAAEIGPGKIKSVEKVGTIKARGTASNSMVNAVVGNLSSGTLGDSSSSHIQVGAIQGTQNVDREMVNVAVGNILSGTLGSNNKSNINIATINSSNNSMNKNMDNVLVGNVASNAAGKKSHSSLEVGGVVDSSNSKLAVITGNITQGAVGQNSDANTVIGKISSSKKIMEEVAVANIITTASGVQSSATSKIGVLDTVKQGLAGIDVGIVTTTAIALRDKATTQIGVDKNIDNLTQGILVGNVLTTASGKNSTATTEIGTASNVNTVRQLIAAGVVTTAASGDGTVATTVIGEIDGGIVVNQNIAVGIVTTSSIGVDSTATTKVGAVLGGGQVDDNIVTGIITNHAEAVSSSALVEIGNISSGVTGRVETNILIGDVTNTVTLADHGESRIRVGNVYEQDGGFSTVSVAAGILTSTVAAAIDAKAGIMLGNIKQQSGGNTVVAVGDINAAAVACSGAACDLELLSGGTCVSIGNLGMSCDTQKLDDILGEILKFILGEVKVVSADAEKAIKGFEALAKTDPDRVASLVSLEPVSMQIELATADPSIVDPNVMTDAVWALKITALSNPDHVGKDTIAQAFNAINTIAVKSMQTSDNSVNNEPQQIIDIEHKVAKQAIASLLDIATNPSPYITSSNLGQQAFETLRSVAANDPTSNSDLQETVNTLVDNGSYTVPDSGSGSGSGPSNPISFP